MRHDEDLADQDVEELAEELWTLKEEGQDRLAELVQPLLRLLPGQSGRIVHIVPREPQRLVRLTSFGVVPGATVRLQQKSPAAVLRVGETTLAVEPEIADEIYVKRIG